jgi:hypothetical protein
LGLAFLFGQPTHHFLNVSVGIDASFARGFAEPPQLRLILLGLSFLLLLWLF